MSRTDFDQLFRRFSEIKVGVVGDVMLDTYCWGKVERISPEAPVPVVSVTNREKRIGGAGNVALNLAALNAKVSILSVVGNDDNGRELTALMSSKNISTDRVVFSKRRITTNKTRVISRNQQMMRLDEEVTNPLLPEDADRFIGSVISYLDTVSPDIIILEDYNKGVLTTEVIHRIIDECKKRSIITSVDPKRKNFFAYKDVDIFKPNLSEAKEGLNIISDEVNECLLKEIHDALHHHLQHKISFITLSEKGVFYQSQDHQQWIPTHVRTIADVSGAGDTVIAVASLVYAATKSPALMAEMANIAGGLVCEEVGTVAINKERLQMECNRLLTEL